eukprot:5265248-Pleurochrysis_carterae.AAC.1
MHGGASEPDDSGDCSGRPATLNDAERRPRSDGLVAICVSKPSTAIGDLFEFAEAPMRKFDGAGRGTAPEQAEIEKNASSSRAAHAYWSLHGCRVSTEATIKGT